MLKISTKNGKVMEFAMGGTITEISADFVILAKNILEALADSDSDAEDMFKHFLKDLFVDLCTSDPDEYGKLILKAVKKYKK